MHRFYCTYRIRTRLTLHLGAAVTLPAVPAYAECATSAEGRNVDATYFAEMLMMLQQKPHPFAVKALMDWKPMESTRACWNPLSTTMETDHSDNFNCLNPPECTMGVQDFPNKVKGQQATSRTLALSFYGGLRNFLSGRSFDAAAIRQSIYTWGGDDAYADIMIDKWEQTWGSAASTLNRPASGATSEPQASSCAGPARQQGQQAMTVWRLEGEAWQRLEPRQRRRHPVHQDTAAGGPGAYMVCAEGSSDSACSDARRR